MTKTYVKVDEQFGLSYADHVSDAQCADWISRSRSLLHKIIALHNKLYGMVGSRTTIMDDLKLVYDDRGGVSLFGNNPNVFPSSYTPLYDDGKFAPEVIYNEAVRTWVYNILMKEERKTHERYVQYVADLSKLAFGQMPQSEVINTAE